MSKKKTSVLSRSEVVEIVETFRSAVAEWEAWEPSTDEEAARIYRNHNGRQVKAVSSPVEKAAAEMFQQLATVDIAQDAWELVLAVDLFEVAMLRWWERLELGAPDVDPQGGQDLWGPWNNVILALTPRPRRRPEAIQSLLAQNVPHRQIAKTYGWYREDGVTPDETKVLDEISKPGTHYNPATYMHPADKRHLAQLTVRWEERVARLEGDGNSPFNQAQEHRKRRTPEGRAQRVKKPAPESLEELIRMGVPIMQIAKMKQIEPDDVRRRAAEMGVFNDPSVHAFANTAEQLNSRQQAEIRRINSHPEYDNIEDRVLAIAEDGHPAGVIAQVMRANGHPEVEITVVERILNEAAITE